MDTIHNSLEENAKAAMDDSPALLLLALKVLDGRLDGILGQHYTVR